MAMKIGDDCISCGACASECPTEAISQGDTIYVIDPARCSECVGFNGESACVAVCPTDVIAADPDKVETEEQLIEKARRLFPDKGLPSLAELTSATSHFRKPA